jgi:hypothetical protein
MYSGQFENGQKSGLGILRDINNNTVYEGQFRNNRMDGDGKLTTFRESKSVPGQIIKECYEGKFLNGYRHGKGRLFISDQGLWAVRFLKGNMANELGHFEDVNTGNVYHGDLHETELTGYGVMTFKNKTKHVGKFVSGIANGHGYGVARDGSKGSVGMYANGQLLYLLDKSISPDILSWEDKFQLV